MREAVDYVFFEALFERSLDASGEFEAGLRARGFDRRAPRTTYATQVLEDCLLFTCATQFSSLGQEGALRELGRRFVVSFRQTLVGAVLTAALPLLGPKRLLGQVPKRLPRVRTDLVLTLEDPGGGALDLRGRDPHPRLGAFFAGIIHHALEVAGSSGHTVEVVPQPDGYILRVTLAR